MQPSRTDTIDEIIEHIVFSSRSDNQLATDLYNIMNKMNADTHSEFFNCTHQSLFPIDLMKSLIHIASELFEVYTDDICEELELMKDECR